MPHFPTIPELHKRLVTIVLFGALIGAGVSALFNAPASAATSPGLGAAGTFAILAGTPNITNVPSSDITGDVGLSPATGAGIGLTCAEVDGTIFQVDAAGDPCFVTNAGLLTTAKNDLVTAYNGLSAGANAACTIDYGNIVVNLSGETLVPGVYCAGTFELQTGVPLTLNDAEAPDGVWIFRSLSTIGTTPGVGANVIFSTGVASHCNVWWRAESSVAIGSGTDFLGNVLALSDISMGAQATLDGRLLARNGAVTLIMNTINADECLPPTGPEATATQLAAASATQAAAASATQAAAATATQAALATLVAQCCGAGSVDITLGNSNSNTIGIGNDNENTNANNQNNNNANANSNDQTNNNQNTNTQQQDNDQDQANSNDQANNIESGPSVNIDGAPGVQKPPGAAAPPSAIKPPSTGSGGLPWGSESASPFRGLLLGALAGALVAGAVASWEFNRARR